MSEQLDRLYKARDDLIREAFRLSREKDELAAQLAEREAEVERYREALGDIDRWSRAYPKDIFPEPDWQQVRILLAIDGITLDAVSGSILRPVVDGIGQRARAALAVTQPQDANMEVESETDSSRISSSN